MFTYTMGRINGPFYIIDITFYENNIKYNLEVDIDFNEYSDYIFIFDKKYFYKK